MRNRVTISILLILFSFISTITYLDEASSHSANTAPSADTISNSLEQAIQTKYGALKLKYPEMDPMKGKILFVDKGCIACHAINGIGGHDAPALDAHKMDNLMNPFEFAAKMWKGAPAMIAAQEGAFDTQLLFSGDDLANIIAFVHSDNVQHTFNSADLTDKARKMMNHRHGETTGDSHHSEEIGHGKSHHGGKNAKPHAHDAK
jgi:cytochrome c